jgi:hypothetical protein
MQTRTLETRQLQTGPPFLSCAPRASPGSLLANLPARLSFSCHIGLTIGYTLPCSERRDVLQDRPLPNGPTETISAPHMHAAALELLSSKLQPGNRVLDVGSVRPSRLFT